MPWNKKLLRSCSLYLVLDADVNSYQELFEIAKKSVLGGVDIIQLRDKKSSAKKIIDFSKELKKVLKNKIPLIINDRVDVALEVGADGVHLGQDDISVLVARKLMGKNAVIGKSCQTYSHVAKAQRESFDYVGFGSVFKTETKPDRKPMDLKLLQKIFKTVEIPVFAIGGITLNNISQLTKLGVDRIAVTRAISKATDPLRAMREFKMRV